MKRFFLLLLAVLVFATGTPDTASAANADTLINNAKKYLGIKYRYGGANPKTGLDCSAFTQIAFRDTGISIPRTTGTQYKLGSSVAKNSLKKGDLVFFNTTGRGVSHVGIHVTGGQFIHASTSRGVSFASIYDKYYWGSRYLGARRVANLDVAPKPAPAPQPAAPAIDYPTRAEIAETLVGSLQLPTPEATVAFNDVASTHPQANSIQAVAAAGIFTGAAGSFMPEGNLTRSQLAKVLVEAFNLQRVPGAKELAFSDVPGDFGNKEYITILAENNVTTGYGNGVFGINDKVTMSQFETFIERAKKATNN